MIFSLRSDRVLADLDYCLIRGVEAGTITAEEWRKLIDVYRSIKLLEPLVADIIRRIRARERGGAS
jgi:hypothetical protein